MNQKRVEWIEFGPNQFIDVIWGTPDYERLNGCFDRIAKGLHYHHFGRRFSGATKVLLGYTRNDLPDPAEFQRFIRDKVASELEGKSRIGSNPDVFTFQFTDPDQFGIYLVHLQFYGGLDVYVSLIPEDCEFPRNFPMDLIDMGIPTVIVDRGVTYHFNAEKDADNQMLN
jgi:hypothetical protein